MASLVIVETYFREPGHCLTLNEALHRELSKLGLQTRTLVPRNFAFLQPDFPFEASLPIRLPSGKIRDRVPYGLRLFWSILLTPLPPGTTIFWPIPGVPEMIAACLLAIFKGRLPQVFLLQIPLAQLGHGPGPCRVFGLADCLNRLLGWRWRYIPSTDGIATAYADIGIRNIEKPVEICYHLGQSEPASTEPCTLAYLGEARANKGFHLVVDLALELQARDPGKYRFVCQVQAQADHSDPTIADSLRRLAEAGPAGLELHHGRLSAEKYLDLLGKATYVLLPYDPAVYSELQSGVCCEAWAAGRPVIASRGSWGGKLVEQNGCGLLFDYPGQLLDAVEEAWRQRAALTRKAWEYRQEWRETRTPEQFARRLLRHA
jgi:glycosyltransferase involved in cell wall biosynthesis